MQRLLLEGFKLFINMKAMPVHAVAAFGGPLQK
jgi:hypothetical protein